MMEVCFKELLDEEKELVKKYDDRKRLRELSIIPDLPWSVEPLSKYSKLVRNEKCSCYRYYGAIIMGYDTTFKPTCMVHVIAECWIDYTSRVPLPEHLQNTYNRTYRFMPCDKLQTSWEKNYGLSLAFLKFKEESLGEIIEMLIDCWKLNNILSNS